MRSFEGLKEWLTELKKFLRREPCWIHRAQYLRYAGKVFLGSTNSVDSIFEAKEVFPGYIDSVFENLLPGKFFTIKTDVHYYDLIRHGSFAEIFSEFTWREFEFMRLTQSQIRLFCSIHTSEIRAGATHGLLFFFTEHDMPVSNKLSNLHVVYVYIDDRNGKPIASHRSFLLFDSVWRAKRRDPYRFVSRNKLKKWHKTTIE